MRPHFTQVRKAIIKKRLWRERNYDGALTMSRIRLKSPLQQRQHGAAATGKG